MRAPLLEPLVLVTVPLLTSVLLFCLFTSTLLPKDSAAGRFPDIVGGGLDVGRCNPKIITRGECSPTWRQRDETVQKKINF